jgi:Patatin-like phospholipase
MLEAEALSVWEVLRDELNFIIASRSEATSCGVDDERGINPRERLKRELLAKHPTVPSRKQEIGEIQQRDNSDVCSELHAARLSGLALSGGGIRSATVGLGVLQALARCKSGKNESEESLIEQFDYVSTVSGGGYIGGWLSSWISHCGIKEVVRSLSSEPTIKLNPEPVPVQNLRNYSNYLNPKIGFGSADSWTLGATILRNILLNWLVILPLLACALLLPRLLLSALNEYPRGSDPLLKALMAIGVLFGFVAFEFVMLQLPAPGLGKPDQTAFLRFSMVPLIVGAAAFAAYAVLQPAVRVNWWIYPLCGASVLFIAVALAATMRLVFHSAVKLSWIIGAAGAVALSAGFGGMLVFIARNSLLSHFKFNLATSQVHEFWVVFAIPILFAALFLSLSLLVGLASKITLDYDREWLARAAAWILISALAWMVIASVSIWGPAAWAAFTSVLATLVGGLVAYLGHGSQASTKKNFDFSKLPISEKVRQVGIALLLPIFLGLLLIALSALNQTIVCSFWRGRDGDLIAQSILLSAEFALSLLAAVFVNVNKFSLHGMYKMRLIRAFLGASRSDRKPNRFTGFDPNDNVHLKNLRHRPFHLVNMALNLVAGSNLAWQERKAASFTASPLHVGSLWWGYRPVEQYSDSENGMTLGGAVTISGAAASPNMGYHSSSMLTVVMTLFNARLGAWLGNPGPAGQRTWFKDGPTFGWRTYIDELFGFTTEDNNWVYLSDGGHFENLGIYELVLRRCHAIVAVDASCDQGYSYEDLGNAVRKVRTDLGIPIEFPDGIHIAGGTGAGGTHSAVGRIKYTEVDGSNIPDGWLIYIKPALVGNEPADVAQYARAHPEFPHESTSDQWFSESQFESYRALGEFMVSEIIGSSHGCDVHEFVERAHSRSKEANRK